MKIELSPICEKCNNPLTVVMQNYDTKKEVMRVYIAPCEFCLPKATSDGVIDGMKRAGAIAQKVLSA